MMLPGISQPAPSSAKIHDVEEATHAFSNAGIDLRWSRVDRRNDFSLDIKLLQLGASELIWTQWGTDNWSTVELPGRMALILNPGRDSPSVFTTSGHSVPASTEEAPILQPGRKIRVFRPAQMPLIVLSAQMKDLESLAEEITGKSRRSLEFELGLNLRSSEGKRLRRIIDFVVQELKEEPSAAQHPIVRRQLDDLLLNGMLSLPGNHHHLDDPNHSVASKVVRRAEHFMEANIDRPIGMSEVAAACDCSRSKLFQAFKRERQWTPLQFLIRRRMERARRRLLAPSDSTTVTMVSLECGYANISRFAQEYRRLYAEPPSMTLHRSR